jgi:hypothetical protein
MIVLRAALFPETGSSVRDDQAASTFYPSTNIRLHICTSLTSGIAEVIVDDAMVHAVQI